MKYLLAMAAGALAAGVVFCLGWSVRARLVEEGQLYPLPRR